MKARTIAQRHFNFEVPSLEMKAFGRISELARTMAGIKLDTAKKDLVRARLSSRLRTLKLRCFDDYVKHLEADTSGEEILTLIDLLTTNKTLFFRQKEQFAHLKEELLPSWKDASAPLRIWSAGCSTGQEPYSLAMLLAHNLLNHEKDDVKVLATDISRPVLAKAKAGVYAEEALSGISRDLRRYFKKIETGPPALYRVIPQLREFVYFARLNLMGEWPMRGRFQAILCRNVMIYFDKTTREELVNRFWHQLAWNGSLFLGEAESLNGIRSRFKYVRPGIYGKEKCSPGRPS